MVEQVSLLERLGWICNTLFHQTLAVVSIFIFWIIFYNFKLDSLFTWHLVLSTLAYIPLMAEAIILFGSDNVWSQKLERTTKYYIHGVLLVICGVLATVGMALEVHSKTSNHFESLHAITGLVSWILVLASQIFGIAALKAQAFKSLFRPVYVKFLHNFLGLLGYIFGVVSLAYGLYKGSFKSLTSDEARLATVWLLGITTAWSILAALRSGFNQIKTIFS